MTLTIKKPSLQGATDVEVWYVPAVSGAGYASDFLAFTVSAQFTGIGASMVAGQLFAFTSAVDCWIAQGANPTASKAVGSMFVQKGVQILIDGAQGGKLAVVQDVGGGNASLVRIDA